LIEEELLREALIQVLRGGKPFQNYPQLLGFVKPRLKEEIGNQLAKHPHDTYYERDNLRPEDEWTLHRLTWDLIIQGVLVPGSPGNPAWPNLSLTPYGKHTLEKTGPTPYDPSSYFQEAFESANKIDVTVMTYLKESVNSFRRGLYLASTVMLGVASEAAFLSLCDVVSQKAGEKKAEKIKRANTLNQKHALVMPWITQSGNLDDDPKLKNSVDTFLDDLFHAYRLTRNTAGHPTGVEIPREEVYAHLTTFPHYLRTVAGLIEHLKRI